MREVSVKIYQFDELSDKAKEVARDWYRGLIDVSDYESTADDVAAVMKMLGYDAKLFWSGFSQQGSGACFDGTWAADEVKSGKVFQYAPVDEELKAIATIIEGIAKSNPGLTSRLTHSGHYYHENSVVIETIFDGDFDVMSEEQRSTHSLYVRTSRRFMKWAYKQLENQNEYLYSEEYVDDTIKANEYEFTEDGKRWSK